jgi:hypothetical protein
VVAAGEEPPRPIADRWGLSTGGAAGRVNEYSVAADGTLSGIGQVTVPDASDGEGIVAQ